MGKPRLKPLVVDAEQRSEVWFKARLGKVTGSKVANTMAWYIPTKKQFDEAHLYYQEAELSFEEIDALEEKNPIEFLLGAGIDLAEKADRKSYREDTVTERITGMPADPDPYITKEMLWGQMLEAVAINVYQLRQRCLVEKAPFLLHPEWACGASPDGFSTDLATGEIGNIEAKCLKSKNHLYKVIKTQTVPEEYLPQIQMQMWINGADWCDFIGYDSRVPVGLDIFVKRVPRDDTYIDDILEPAVRRFLSDCDADEQWFRKLIREKEESSQKLSTVNQ